jgi:hypothetical protein
MNHHHDDRADPGQEPARRPLFQRTHKKRSPLPWIIALAGIIVLMVYLPRIMGLLLGE